MEIWLCNLGNCTDAVTRKRKKNTKKKHTKKKRTKDDQQKRRNGVLTNDFCGQVGDGQVGDGSIDGDISGELIAPRRTVDKTRFATFRA
jgi:hypothetical protein